MAGVLLDQVIGDLRQEAADGVVLDLAAQHPGPGAGQGQVLHGPGDADVGQAAFLLESVAAVVLEGEVAGKDPVLHAGDIDVGKFQALGAVEGHQEDPVVIAVDVIDVGDQGDVLEKARQGGLCVLLFHALLVIGHLADQLVDIFFAVLRVLLSGVPEGIDIAGDVQHMLQEFSQGVGQGIFPALQDHISEIAELEPGFFDARDLIALLHDGEEAGLLQGGVFGRPSQGRGPDPSSGDIDDPADSQVVSPVVDGLEVAQDILDLSSVVEVGAAHDIVGEGPQDQAFLQEAGLGIGPVEDGKTPVGQGPVAPHLVLYVLRDKGGLLHGRREAPHMDAGPPTAVCPEGLVLAGPVVADHGIGRVQDILGGPVVLLQADDHGVRIDLFEVQDIADVRAPEFVDGLVVVADHAEVPVFAREEADQLELGPVGVLVLVDHDIAEALLVHVQDLVVGVEEPDRQHEEVIKVHCVVLAQKPLVLLVGHADLLFPEALPVVLLTVLQGGQKLVLRGGHRGQDLPLLQVLCIDPQVFAGLLHQGLLVVGVVYDEGGLIAQKVDMAAEDPHAHGVEGRDPDSLTGPAQDLVHAVPHLAGGLVGEGDRQDIPGIDLAFVDQVCDPVGDHPGLAAAGAGQDQDRTFCLEAGLLLLPVECLVD